MLDLRDNKIASLWHACLALLGTCTKGVQFYVPLALIHQFLIALFSVFIRDIAYCSTVLFWITHTCLTVVIPSLGWAALNYIKKYIGNYLVLWSLYLNSPQSNLCCGCCRLSGLTCFRLAYVECCCAAISATKDMKNSRKFWLTHP